MASKEVQRMWKLAARYSSLGIEVAVEVAIGTLGGIWIDGKLGTAPGFMIFGLIVGIGAAAKSIMRIVRRSRVDLQ